LSALLLGLLAWRWRFIPLALERRNLLLKEREPGDLPSDLAGKSWRQRSPVTGTSSRAAAIAVAI